MKTKRLQIPPYDTLRTIRPTSNIICHQSCIAVVIWFSAKIATSAPSEIAIF